MCLSSSLLAGDEMPITLQLAAANGSQLGEVTIRESATAWYASVPELGLTSTEAGQIRRQAVDDELDANAVWKSFREHGKSIPVENCKRLCRRDLCNFLTAALAPLRAACSKGELAGHSVSTATGTSERGEARPGACPGCLATPPKWRHSLSPSRSALRTPRIHPYTHSDRSVTAL